MFVSHTVSETFSIK